MGETKSAKYEPHVMLDIVDPSKDGLSSAWKGCLYFMLLLEVLQVMFFIWNSKGILAFPEQIEGKITLSIILDSIVWKNVLRCVVILISLVIVPYVWHTIAGNQTKLDYTIEHTKFKIRNEKGLESFSKYGYNPKKVGVLYSLLRFILRHFHFFANPRDVIISFTGILHFDRETGLTAEKINDDTWALNHPYQGDHGFNLLAVPMFADSEEVIIANFLEAVNTLGPDHLVSTTMISGHNVSYIMDDIEEQLKLPGLSPVREKALWSVYNKFKNRVGTDEPIFIIHIGLPPAVHEYEHVENMRKVRDEFELTLNEIGIDTVLIKDPEDLAYIINGMFTGNLVMGKDINEY